MKTTYLFFIFPIVFLLLRCNSPRPNGISKYENMAAISDFAPELWIKGNTYKGSFSDDFNTFFFFRKVAPDSEKYLPYETRFTEGAWGPPQLMPYSNPSNSYTYQLKVPNSNRLVFISDMRTKNDTVKHPNYNFWSLELKKNMYGEPKELGFHNLIYNYNSQPCITNSGSLYFTSDLPDWSATLSYRARFVDDNYEEPTLFAPVNNWRANTAWTVYEFCVSPDEEYMIVSIQDNSASNPSVDLYISYANDGQWTAPKKLSNEINTSETENFPTITKDGKFLIFTRGFSAFKIVPTALFQS